MNFLSISQSPDDAWARHDAAAHDRLWRNNRYRAVDLEQFPDGFCDQLAASASGNSVQCRTVSIEVSTESAVTIGLLINGLVTNAFKYAYGDEGRQVIVEPFRDAGWELRLSAGEPSQGLPANFQETARGGGGLKHLRSLGVQPGGRTT
jgi:two-component sensor histidine kinase